MEDTERALSPPADFVSLPEERERRRVHLSFVGAPVGAPGAPVARRGLPVPTSSFVGRGREVDAVCRLLLLPHVRLVTLTGPAGIGKTRLSLAVAARLAPAIRDGLCFVPFGQLCDPVEVIPAIAEALGLRASAGHSPVTILQECLADREALLLLDDFEAVVEAAPRLALLMESCGGVKLLVTSREALRLRGEYLYEVPALSLPGPDETPSPAQLGACEAVQLFVARAQEAKPDFALTRTNSSAVAELCRRLEGVPLAIELAAARTRLFPPQALLGRMGQPLSVLTHGARDLPERLQTMRAAIDTSYEILDEPAKRLFRRLSIFAGGCTLEAVEGVCGGRGDFGEDPADCLESLVDKSLVRQEDAGPETRFVMLETVREYARERLEQSGEHSACREDHARHFVRMAEEWAAGLWGHRQLECLDRLEAEHDNLRAACAWTLESGEVALGLGLAVRLTEFWSRRGHLGEGRGWLRRLLAAAPAAPRLARAQGLNALAYLAGQQGDFDICRDAANEALALGWEQLARDPADAPRARAVVALALANVGATFLGAGDPAAALSKVEESLVLYRELAHRPGLARTLCLAALIATERGDHDAARSFLDEARPVLRDLDDRQGSAYHLLAQGILALAQGDHRAARACFERQTSLVRELGERRGLAAGLSGLGAALDADGDYPAATSAYGEALTIMIEIADRFQVARTMRLLARGAVGRGDPESAAGLLGRLAELSEDGLLSGVTAPRDAGDDLVAAIRRELGEETFARAWYAGRGLTVEEVIARAIPSSDPPAGPPGEASPAGPGDALTRRERQIAILVGRGLSNREIASELVISDRTAETHLANIMKKLGVGSRYQVAIWATTISANGAV